MSSESVFIIQAVHICLYIYMTKTSDANSTCEDKFAMHHMRFVNCFVVLVVFGWMGLEGGSVRFGWWVGFIRFGGAECVYLKQQHEIRKVNTVD